MQKKLAVLAVLLASIVGCCSHPVEVGALKDLEVKQEKYFWKYLKYVDADPALDAAKKNDEHATVGAIQRQTTSVRKSLEGGK